MTKRQQELQQIEQFVQSGRVRVLPNIKTWEEITNPHQQSLLNNVQAINMVGGYRKKSLPIANAFGFSTAWAIVVICISLIASMAVYSAIVYIAVHFIKKFW